MSGVITTGLAGTAFVISLPFGVSSLFVPKYKPRGDVSTIWIGPALASAPCNNPGKPSPCDSRSTKKSADPPHLSPLLIPAPSIATYLSLSRVLPVLEGILAIFGVDHVSPSLE